MTFVLFACVKFATQITANKIKDIQTKSCVITDDNSTWKRGRMHELFVNKILKKFSFLFSCEFSLMCSTFFEKMCLIYFSYNDLLWSYKTPPLFWLKNRHAPDGHTMMMLEQLPNIQNFYIIKHFVVFCIYAAFKNFSDNWNYSDGNFGRDRVKSACEIYGCFNYLTRWSSNRPLAFWSAGGRQERLWGHQKNSNFFIGCSVTVSIVLPQKSCGNKIRCPQSLSWRLTAGQRAWGLWVRDWWSSRKKVF